MMLAECPESLSVSGEESVCLLSSESDARSYNREANTYSDQLWRAGWETELVEIGGQRSHPGMCWQPTYNTLFKRSCGVFDGQLVADVEAFPCDSCNTPGYEIIRISVDEVGACFGKSSTVAFRAGPPRSGATLEAAMAMLPPPQRLQYARAQ